jgi:hypothetical protein
MLDFMLDLKMMVAGINSNGEPDFYFCKLICTEDDYDNGYHYKFAMNKAEQADFEPKLAFDQDDAAGKAIVDHFSWESADTFTVQSECFSD